MPGTRASLPYIRALDGLRGLAVLAILLFHAGHLTGGWLGVDVFFVLSGFLITSLLLTEHESTGDVSLTGFWGRRARRLIPALLATLFGVSLYAALLAEPEELARIRADTIATLFYVQNWHAIAAGHDYWELFRYPSPLDHSWSLSIEEQFYLLWPPIVLLLLRRASRRTLAVTAGSLALLSAGWMALLFDPHGSTARVYFGTDTRMFATLVGAVVAVVLRSQVRAWPGPPNSSADVVALIGLSAVFGASLSLDGSEPVAYRGGLFSLVLASAAVVAGLILSPRGLAALLLGAQPLRLLGIWSYGIYLWHWPIYLVLTPERVGFGGWPLTGLRVAVTLLVAGISYAALEQPIRRREWLVKRPVATALGTGAALIACVWLATLGAATASDARDEPAPLLAGSDADLLLIGDSLAYQLRDEFLKEARRRGHRAEALASEGCVALRSQAMRFLSGQVFGLEPCLRFREGWIDWVARFRPNVVLLLEGWPGEGDKSLGGRWTHPCQADFDAAYAADLGDLVESFAASGATTVLALLPPPSLPDLSPSYAKNWGGTGEAELDALFRERIQCQNQVRAEVARNTGALLVDLQQVVCPGGACRRELDGFTLRPDGVHFQGEGAAWASRWLLDRITR